MPVALHVAADHPAVEHAERGEQGGRPVAFIIVGHRPEPPRLHRQAGLRAVERLDLALLVDAENHRVGRRIDVEADDVLHLVGERRIAGELERPKPMRSELMGAPDALDGTDRDADGGGHGAGGPVRRFVRRVGVRQGDDSIDDRLVERCNARRARLIAHQTIDAVDHVPFLPSPDTGLGLAGLAHDRIGPETGGGQKHDPRTPDVLLGAVPIEDDRIQSLTIRIGQHDRDTRAHAPNSHTPDRRGIPRRTQALELNH